MPDTWSLFSLNNLIFFIPLGVFFVLAGLQALGLAFDHDADGHDGAGHEHDGGSGSLLESVGLEGVPLTFVWMPFFLAFGMTGLVYGWLLGGGWGSFALALLLALVTAFVFTQIVARLLRRLFPTQNPTLSKRRELVGRTGVVHSKQLTEIIGEIAVKDSFGNLLYLACRLFPEEKGDKEGQTLKAGDEVAIIDYDEEQAKYIVSPIK